MLHFPNTTTKVLLPHFFLERRNYYAKHRYREYRFYAALLEPRHADDAGAGLFLRGPCGAQKCAGHNDPELCVDGVDDRFVVGVWILGLL